MNKFERNKVSVDCVVKINGMNEIRQLINNKLPGFYMMYQSDFLKLAGGRERVNAQGKMTKRIKRNLRRDHNVTLPDSLVEQIGNIMDQNSLSAREYIVEYTTDLEGTVGRFGDNGSCFKRGGEYRNHLLAMQNHVGNHRCSYLAFRVYKANGKNLGRAWAYNAPSGATVLFNGYGIALDKIALLAARLEGKEPRAIAICSDIYINDEYKSYAIGGERTYYEFYADVDDYDDDDDDDLSWCTLCDCSMPYDDLYHIGTSSLCYACYNRTYQTCNHCGGHCQRSDNPLHKVILRGGTRHVCERCRDAHYQQCDECADFFRNNAIAECNQFAYCSNCAIKLGAIACSDCLKCIMPGHTFPIQYCNKEYDHSARPVCEHCRTLYYECDTCKVDLPYQTCPTCDGETVTRTPSLDFDIAVLEQRIAQARHDRTMMGYTVLDLRGSIKWYTKRNDPGNVKEVQIKLGDALIRQNCAETRVALYEDAIGRAMEFARRIFERSETAKHTIIKVTI